MGYESQLPKEQLIDLHNRLIALPLVEVAFVSSIDEVQPCSALATSQSYDRLKHNFATEVGVVVSDGVDNDNTVWNEVDRPPHLPLTTPVRIFDQSHWEDLNAKVTGEKFLEYYADTAPLDNRLGLSPIASLATELLIEVGHDDSIDDVQQNLIDRVRYNHSKDPNLLKRNYVWMVGGNAINQWVEKAPIVNSVFNPRRPLLSNKPYSDEHVAWMLHETASPYSRLVSIGDLIVRKVRQQH